jgi:peroxiredoxin
MGGDFIIDSMGIVRLAYRSKEPADRPSVDKLLKIIKDIP